jgi:uncharacterized protein (TIGR03382 family)
MKLQTLPLVALLILTFASTGAALPPPCEEDAMQADSTMIIDGAVSDVACVGEPVAEAMMGGGTSTTTTYISTVQVSETYKGDAMDSVQITGVVVEYSDDANPPVGGWWQPALKQGMKGKFYLVDDAENNGYKYVCWNAAIEAEDSAPADLPECAGGTPVPEDPCGDGMMGENETDVDCGGESCSPCADGKKCKIDDDCAGKSCTDGTCGAGTPGPVDFTPPNPCWKDECVAEYDTCAAMPSCVAWNDCLATKEGDALSECLQAVADSDPSQMDDNGNHVVYRALQECGWDKCNDPNAGLCADPGKGGEVNKCGQWDDAWPCNCDDACTQYDDCCADYDDVCGSTTPDPPPCTPSCGNKDCGADGCGGTCGECGAGQICSKAQLCVDDVPDECQDACADGDKGCEDGAPWSCALAGSGCYEKFAGSACAEGEACAEGVCASTEPAPPVDDSNDNTNSDSGDDGGCSSSDPINTGGTILLALVLLGLAVRRESDETLA